MIKSAIFLGIYATVGMAGWTAYDTLSGKQPILSELGVNANSLNKLAGMINAEKPPTNKLYRWKDKDGQWQYASQAPEGIASQSVSYDVKGELEQLKRLPSQVLPTGKQHLQTAQNDADNAFVIPGIPDMKTVAKLLQDATGLQSKFTQHKEQIDSAIKQ